MSSTAVQPSLRPDYSPEQQQAWLSRHRNFVARARRGQGDIVFIGDSITDGWRTHGRAVWDKDFRPLCAVNFGLPGDRTQQLLWRLVHGTLEGLHPKVVVVMIGTNNLDPGLGANSLTPRNTVPEIIAGIGTVVLTLRRLLPSARVLLLGLLPRGYPTSALRQEVAAINAGLSAAAAGDPHVHFLDTGRCLLNPDGTISPEIMPDQLHPRAQGYQILAREITPALHQLLAAADREISPGPAGVRPVPLPAAP